MRLCVHQPCVKVFGNSFLALRRLAGDGRDKIRRDCASRVRLFNQPEPVKFLFGVGLAGCLERFLNQRAVI
jgi:hypothetical protein